MPEVKLNIAEGTQEIVLRQGNAEVLHEPLKVSVNGLINAPSTFFKVREGTFDLLKTHIIVNRNNQSLILVIDENNPFGSRISGQLKYNKELADFQINKEKMYSLKELTNLLRIKRMYFSDRNQNAKTLELLYAFEAKAITEIKDSDNRKGNSNKQLKKDTTSNVPGGFKLTIPIYEGQDAKTFFVDILADISEVQVKFWLESVDLIELEYDSANEIINKELEVFKDRIVILEV